MSVRNYFRMGRITKFLVLNKRIVTKYKALIALPNCAHNDIKSFRF